MPSLTTVVFALLLWIASAVGIGAWQHHQGELAQKADDQAQFDKINADIAKQKAEATEILARNTADNLKLMTERDQLKTDLEKAHAQHTADTNALRDRYAGVGLRFKSTQTAGCGDGGANQVPAAASAAGPAAPADVQLPDAIAGRLRQLTFDADTLADNYKTCYAYVQSAK